MSIKRLVLLIACIFLLFTTPVISSDQAENDRIIIVLDSSGSMWGQIEGLSKYKIAQNALNNILPKLSNRSVGLIAYGHRRKSDCTDIELISPLNKDNGANITSAISELKPIGKTPLSAAVKQAADLLSFTSSKATVILITDGVETCDADPCVLGSELSQQGIDFTAHVIGFGLSAQEGRQVSCLAEETGGIYLNAENADSLSDALQNVAKTVEEPPQEITDTAQATLNAPESAEIGQTFDVNWEGPANTNDYIDLVNKNHEPTSEGTLSNAPITQGNPVKIRASKYPGTYDLRYIWVNSHGRQTIARTSISIVDAEVALLAPEQVGIGQHFTVEWKGPANERDYIDLVVAGFSKTSKNLSSVSVKKGSPATLQAPAKPGTYSIRYIFDGPDGKRVIKENSIVVEEVRTEIAFNPIANIGERLSLTWAGPGNKRDYIDLVPRGQTKTSKNISTVSVSKGNPVEIALPKQAGEYDVRYILYTRNKKEVLAVSPLTVK